MSNTFMIYGIAIFGVIVAVYYFIDIYNTLQQLHNLIPEARSNINILLAKRDDLISQLLRIVKSYGIHENQILLNVSGDFGKSSNGLHGTSLVNRLASLRMQFPSLVADHLYEELIIQLSSVEAELQQRRERLSSKVRAYNTYILQFPNSYISRRFNFQPKEYLEDNDIVRIAGQLNALAENCHP